LQIQGIALSAPSLSMSNGDLLDEIRRRNSERKPEEVERYCARVGRFLVQTGAATRFVRDRKSGETALSLMLRAAREALDQAGLKPVDIDLVIFCGIGRGFIEPANAAFFCRALGVACDNFDVSEACMSWVRSLHIAYNYLGAGAYRRIMIVNGEFNVSEERFNAAFNGIDAQSLRYSFPAFTIGEAASAAVLTASAEPWSFMFRYAPDSAPLCSIPLAEFAEFSEADPRIGLNGIDRLTSFGGELMANGVAALIEVAEEEDLAAEGYDLWIPHAASGSLCEVAAKRLNLGSRLYGKVFPRYGNLASASVPAGIVMAREEGAIGRGDRLLLCPASAGTSIAIVKGKL
jgi:3-oxoacyl-[acyl-carrier-protein] synthase III